MIVEPYAAGDDLGMSQHLSGIVHAQLDDVIMPGQASHS